MGKPSPEQEDAIRQRCKGRTVANIAEDAGVTEAGIHVRMRAAVRAMLGYKIRVDSALPLLCYRLGRADEKRDRAQTTLDFSL